MDNNYIDIMTFDGVPRGLVGSISAAIDDFCLSVCVPPLDDMSKAPPLRWSACLAYVGKVATVKYIKALFNYSSDGFISDIKNPCPGSPVLNDSAPQAVRDGIRDLVPLYIWLCGLYNKIIIPDDFSAFCGFPIGIDGAFLGSDKKQSHINIELFSDTFAPQGSGGGSDSVADSMQDDSIFTNTINHSNNSAAGAPQDDFKTAFSVGGECGAGGGLASWKQEILNSLQARQNSAVGSVLLDTRYPSIVWDSKKLDKQTENAEKFAPIALKLADLPRLV